MRVVWPTTVVEKNNLQVHISALRRAFGDERERLRTVPGRGYRLVMHDDIDARDGASVPSATQEDVSVGVDAARPSRRPLPARVPAPICASHGQTSASKDGGGPAGGGGGR